MNTVFKYAVLRYVHSQVLKESVNIGILVFFPEQGQVVFTSSEQRLNALIHLYPNFSTSHIQAYLDGLTKRAHVITAEFNSATKRAIEENLERFIQIEFLPEDATVLQFSKIYTSLLYSEDINQVMVNLLETYKLNVYNDTPAKVISGNVIKSQPKIRDSKIEERKRLYIERQQSKYKKSTQKHKEE
ncbi:DUF3037 domain-containing protein [uncultured Microscilla sp.]|uniref:DUF3037 domain-containing protein n=1 Tax=uncultured Microscilla sp. TaxID=432653 RepID=UPI00260D0076|nr:DUF3037 domain-containing protein [uncultured Microscilla sp.]